jgi:hypothetical protein
MYIPICPGCNSTEVSIEPNRHQTDIHGSPIVRCGCIHCGRSWQFVDTNREFVPIHLDPSLKPCPFCCGSAEIQDHDDDYDDLLTFKTAKDLGLDMGIQSK